MPSRPEPGYRVRGAAFRVLPLLAAITGLGAQGATAKATPDSSAFYRAMDLEGAGKYREAAAEFRRSLFTPTSVSALLGLERVYAELKITDSLLVPLDSLIRAFPKEPIYRSVQLRSLQSLGREPEQRQAFERWIQESPKDPTAYREYSRQLLQSGQAVRADSILARARVALGGTGDVQLEVAQARAALGQWEESATAWRQALINAPYLEQAAAYALATAPLPQRDVIRAQFFAPPMLVAARRTMATLEGAWGSPANGWVALRDLPPDSASATAWLDFAQRAEAEERWTHAREALASVLKYRQTPDVALRAAVAALNSGDPGGALQLAPLTGGGA
ncbi:MAG: hypothetical protein AABZ80_03685, partial [Gemmatimonadota bacterium]